MIPAGDATADVGLIKRVEALLESLTAVVSARALIDEEKGTQVHLIVTTEMPMSEVSRAVMSALTWGIGLDVPPEQIMVVQSRLSRDELNDLLDRKKTESPTHGHSPEDRLLSPPSPQASFPDTGLLEFSIGECDSTAADRPDFDLRRFRLEDFRITKKRDGRWGVTVRLGANYNSIAALREGGETEADMLDVPANATLDAIQEFLHKQRTDGPGVALKLLGTRRLRHPHHDIVVVLIAALLNGRNVPLTGAASADQGVVQAAILATLQATNAFVAGTLLPEQPGGTGSE